MRGGTLEAASVTTDSSIVGFASPGSRRDSALLPGGLGRDTSSVVKSCASSFFLIEIAIAMPLSFARFALRAAHQTVSGSAPGRDANLRYSLDPARGEQLYRGLIGNY